jgi:hypothetical protein
MDSVRREFLRPLPRSSRLSRLAQEHVKHGPWARYVESADSRGIGTVRYPRRAPRDAECAKQLAKRTLTNLYNQRPAWLDHAHRRLDEAVFAAYGWPADLTDDEILAKLLELNLAREPAR